MIRGVLGSRASIGGVLGSGRGGAAAAWYLAGGVSAANCVAAYQPKGAASLAASYTNLANPGTYNAAPGTAPTFAAATGWTFAATSSQYLTTGIVPASGWSALVRFSDAVATPGQNAPVLGSGVNGANNAFQLVPYGVTVGAAIFAYGTGYITGSGYIANGIIGIAATAAYLDGSSIGTISGTFSGTGVALFVGAHNNAGAPGRYVNAKIQAVAIYNVTLSAAQVAAISTAMAAL